MLNSLVVHNNGLLFRYDGLLFRYVNEMNLVLGHLCAHIG